MSGPSTLTASLPGFAAPPAADIASSAARLGHYVWASSRLFEITGAWATTTAHRAADVVPGPDPGDATRFLGASGRFAWQAAEWHRRLPRLREVDRAALVIAPTASSGEFFDGLARTMPDGRRSALVGCVTALDDVYRAHAGNASPIRDAIVLRSIARVRADLADLVAEFTSIG